MQDLEGAVAEGYDVAVGQPAGDGGGRSPEGRQVKAVIRQRIDEQVGYGLTGRGELVKQRSRVGARRERHVVAGLLDHLVVSLMRGPVGELGEPAEMIK